jgi:LmbE family N-acetylglucosaminyl deacetylase
MSMKQLLFGVFAHPDDEAFGPSATLLKQAQAGAELHLICATYGENGFNPDQHEDLGAVRRDEWHAAGKRMGAAHLHALGYTDGTLCNNMYFDIAANLDAIVRDAASRYPEGCEISFMTFDTQWFVRTFGSYCGEPYHHVYIL